MQVEKTMLRSELIALQNEGHHTHARLNALLSRPVNAPLAEPVQLRAMPPAAKLDETTLLDRLRAQNPQLRIAEANIQSSEKSRDLAYNNRYPGFTLGVAPNQSGSAVRSWDLMVEFSIPLQQSSRRSQEREAEAQLSASNARKEALLNQTQSELSENLSALESASRTESLVTTRLLPQAELTYQSALAGYETGKVDFAMLIEAQKQLPESTPATTAGADRYARERVRAVGCDVDGARARIPVSAPVPEPCTTTRSSCGVPPLLLAECCIAKVPARPCTVTSKRSTATYANGPASLCTDIISTMLVPATSPAKVLLIVTREKREPSASLRGCSSKVSSVKGATAVAMRYRSMPSSGAR